VHVIGLTGGIGAGKSTVAMAFAERGAVIVDADQIAREVVEPGGPAYKPLVSRFGAVIVGTDGRIDRPALAGVAFADPEALKDLNAITHPAIGTIMAARMAEQEGSDRMVVLDIPLLGPATKGQWPFEAIVVVDTPVKVAVDRLIALRGLTRADAEARVAAQIGRSERRELADVVIDNSGDRRHLEGEIDRAWQFVVNRCAEQ
jgi:dephospho-CoA kinase